MGIIKHCCGRLAHHFLQLAAHQQVEHLVGAAEFHIGLDDNGVVGLEQRVQQLSDGYGALFGETLGEVGPLQKLGHSEAPGQIR